MVDNFGAREQKERLRYLPDIWSRLAQCWFVSLRTSPYGPMSTASMWSKMKKDEKNHQA